MVVQHGGYIFGPFPDCCPEGIFWMPESVKNPDSYKKLIDSRNWKTDGDRVWVAPEIQFNMMDRSRCRKTLDVPKTINPGDFSIERSRDVVTLRQSMDIEPHNTVTGTVHVEFVRNVLKAPNPLRKLDDHDILMRDVSWCGFEQVLDLTEESGQDIYAESWNLLQMRPKGTLYIPMYRPYGERINMSLSAAMNTWPDTVCA